MPSVADIRNMSVPILAVPTTAGTAAEVTINYVITDVEKNRKMVCVDPHDIPVVAFVDSDMFHLKAIEIISRLLRSAVASTKQGRADMALGQYVAGMGFSNIGLGIVHSMAHPLGAFYGTPHGVANAIILPMVMEYNAEAVGDKYIAQAMGVDGTGNMSQEEYRKAAIDAVKQLCTVSIYDACRPGDPKETSVEDITALYRFLM